MFSYLLAPRVHFASTEVSIVHDIRATQIPETSLMQKYAAHQHQETIAS